MYIGFEAGTNERLRKIHKPATVDHNLRAFRLLTEQGIAVQYGFIMFFPDSTVKETEENLKKIESIFREKLDRYDFVSKEWKTG